MRKIVISGLAGLGLAFAAGLAFTGHPEAAGEADDRSLSAAGDAERGKQVFMRCQACHALVAGQHRMGPSLANLFGKKAGTVEGFNRYSNALKEADFVWTEKNLDEWLAAPRSFLPGNKMPFAGLPNEQDRRDLLAYLREATAGE